MHNIPRSHPRYESLVIRERVVEGFKKGVVVPQGLIAHGRGEAFDYLLGEKTHGFAVKAARAAAALMLLSRHPVISVNGNSAVLAGRDLVRLAEVTGALLEVNLFYRTPEREKAIEQILLECGAREVLGVGGDASATIPELHSERRRVSPRGILIADTVLVPLEDGDRTEALRKMGKNVIAIDLNPLSRTAQMASITIVDNIVRAAPLLVREAERLRRLPEDELRSILESYDNRIILGEAIQTIKERLENLANKGVYLEIPW